MTRSVYSTKPGLTSYAERRRPKMVLERASSPSDPPHTDPRSPSDPSRISPVPLQTQSPAHHLPAARPASSSPLRTESQFPPRSTSQRNAERSVTSPSPPLQNPQHPSGSFALRLRLGLLHRWSAPWSRWPFLIHGSSLRRLHRGSPLRLWPGSSLAPSVPSPSSLLHLPMDSVCRPPPGCLSSSWASSQIPTHSSLCCIYGAKTHLPGGGEMSGLDLFCHVFQFLFCLIWSCSCPCLVWL